MQLYAVPVILFPHSCLSLQELAMLVCKALAEQQSHTHSACCLLSTHSLTTNHPWGALKAVVCIYTHGIQGHTQVPNTYHRALARWRPVSSEQREGKQPLPSL